MTKCACGSNREFTNCCEPFINGAAYPATAEELMRSRYTAYTQADIAYLKKTTAPEGRKDFDAEATRKWATESEWERLQIHSRTRGAATDADGIVEFTATYRNRRGERIEHHERSTFLRDAQGHWCFSHGEDPEAAEALSPSVRSGPKVGRNDPCPCGSGAKFKKCCAD